MSKRLLFVGLFVILLSTIRAEACEACAVRFYDQSQTFCHYCVYSYCGYFGCVVRSDSWGDYCDSAWESDGDGGCFTEEGVAKNRCGPDQQSCGFRIQERIVQNRTLGQSEWRLVRSNVRTAKSMTSRDHRQKG